MRPPSQFHRIAILLLLSIAVALGVVGFARDLPRTGDEDLSADSEVVPPERNGVVVLNRAVQHIRYPDDYIDAADRIERALLGLEWDQAWVEELLERNEEALAHFEQARAAPDFQIRVHSTRGERNALGHWLMLSRLHALEAIASGIRGDQVDKLFDLLELARFGTRIRAIDGGRMVHHLLGTSIVRVTLMTFQRVLIVANPTREEALHLLGQLEAVRIDGEGWKRTLRVDYQWRKAILEESIAAHAGNEVASSRDPFAREVLDSMLSLMPYGYSLQRNRTLERLAAHYRNNADIVATPCRSDDAVRRGIDPTARLAPDTMSLERNALGRYWADLNGLTFGIHHGTMCVAESLVSAIEVMVALRAYQAEHGEMPQRLDALVPTYFTAVPIDYFAGGALRYLRDEHLLYSIGSDFRDAGGVWSPGERCSSELVWPIPFAGGQFGPRPPSRLTCVVPRS